MPVDYDFHPNCKAPNVASRCIGRRRRDLTGARLKLSEGINNDKTQLRSTMTGIIAGFIRKLIQTLVKQQSILNKKE